MNYPLPPNFQAEPAVQIKTFLAIPDQGVTIERSLANDTRRPELIALHTGLLKVGKTLFNAIDYARLHSVLESISDGDQVKILLDEMYFQPQREFSMYSPIMIPEISRKVSSSLRSINKLEHFKTWLRGKLWKSSLTQNYESIEFNLYNGDATNFGTATLFAWWERAHIDQGTMWMEMTGTYRGKNGKESKHYDSNTILRNVWAKGFIWNAVDITIENHDENWFLRSSHFSLFDDSPDEYTPILNISCSRHNGMGPINWNADAHIPLEKMDMTFTTASERNELTSRVRPFMFNAFYKNRIQIEVPPRVHIRLKFYAL